MNAILAFSAMPTSSGVLAVSPLQESCSMACLGSGVLLLLVAFYILMKAPHEALDPVVVPVTSRR
ncbi:MAG: hypothetical protein AAB320_01105 [Elusimicrobiota bacterium]